MQSFDATVVVPTNFVLFTISAIISGKSVSLIQVLLRAAILKKEMVLWMRLCFSRFCMQVMYTTFQACIEF